MKIKLRLMFQRDSVAALAHDSKVRSSFNLDNPYLETDSEDEILDHILELTRNTSGCWINPVMEFSRLELEQVRYFQLECRKSVKETARDKKLNGELIKAASFTCTGGRFRIKVLDSLSLSKASLKSNEVACIGDWMPEFIAAEQVGRIFLREGFTGLWLKPVSNTETGFGHEEIVHLYSDKIMPMAVIDLSTPSVEVENVEGGFRQLGCLTYDLQVRDEVADFNRTAENWSSNYMPAWIVSSRVKECFERERFRGWAFRPVLERKTDLYSVYLARWDQLIKRIAVNPRNRF